MEKGRFKVIINWQGETHEYYRWANSSNQALRHAIRELARETGYAARYVRDYVSDKNYRRWEVSK